MKRHLTLVSPEKTLKRAVSRNAVFVSGAYDYNPRDFAFAREHDRSIGELIRSRPITPYSTIGMRVAGVLVALAVVGWMFL